MLTIDVGQEPEWKKHVPSALGYGDVSKISSHSRYKWSLIFCDIIPVPTISGWAVLSTAVRRTLHMRQVIQLVITVLPITSTR